MLTVCQRSGPRAAEKYRLRLSSPVVVVRGKGRGQIEQPVRPDQEDESS
jgi:hypothetical protein